MRRSKAWTSRGLALAAIPVVLFATQGCLEPTYRGRLEIWNRTEAPISVVGRDLTVLVPACTHVTQDGFVLDRYDIVDDHGRFIAWHGGGGSDPSNVTTAYELVTAAGAVYSDSHPPSDPLPACVGVVEGQTP